jgi:uncharacterized protein YebE (UPF0316 family)
MVWSQILERTILWIALIASVVLYSLKRRWYQVMYLVSLALYIFTVVFVIDVFDISKNWILFLLAFSTCVMVGVGFYLSQRQAKGKRM